MTIKYIDFELVEQKPKTSVYVIRNIHSQMIIGYIKWYAQWRQYCFFPLENAVYSVGCLKDIIDFVEQLMKERTK
jgi:penicillin-binding protein-related factor A (putative recombinase)